MAEVRNGALELTREGFFGSQSVAAQEAVDPEAYRIVDDYVREHPGGQEQLIPLLHRVQEHLGYLPFPVQEYVAGKLGMSPVEVYSVVSFYHFFTTTPRGKYQLKVCTGTACFVRRSARLIDTVREELGIDVGEVTEDLRFSIEEVRCLGACGLAPALMINGVVHGEMTQQRLRRLLGALGEKEEEQP